MKDKRVLMLVYSYYPGDTRVRREALTLKENGFEIDIICLKKSSERKREVFENINILRINNRKKRRGFFIYLINYLFFFIKSFFTVTTYYVRKNYSIIHIHNMPNFLVFSALIPKAFGSKVILDIHDPMPELLTSALNTNNRILRKILLLEEKFSILFANKIITTNLAFKDLFVSRGCPKEKITIVMNSPYPEIFDKIKTIDKNDDKFIILYNGSIIKRHGLDILVDAVNMLVDKIPNIKLKIYGTGEFLDEVLKRIKEYKLENYIEYHGGVLIDYLVKEIAECDLGVIPNRLNEFTDLNFPIRIFEFMHYKKPVIAPRTKGIQDYFEENSIFYFTPNDVDDLVNKIYLIYSRNKQINNVIERGYLVYQNNNWEIQSKKLIDLYDNLI